MRERALNGVLIIYNTLFRNRPNKTMAAYDSNIVLNIIPIFNTASADGGVDSTANNSASVAALQTMIDTTTYTVKANVIQPFNSDLIDLNGNTNVTGTFTINGQSISNVFGSNFAVSTANLTISTGAIGFFLLSTPIINNEVGGFQLYASTVFSIDTNNNFLFQPFSSNLSTGGSVYISSLPLIVDESRISTLYLENLFVSQSSILTNLYTTGFSEIPVLLGYSTSVSSLSVTGYSFSKNSSTILGQFGAIQTSTLEVSRPIKNLVVSSLFSSTSTTGILNLSDRLTSASQNLYAKSNILYYNGSPIGGTLSYSFETFSF